MMLNHLGEVQAAEHLMLAIEKVTAAGDFMPADLGGNASTREVTDAVIKALDY